MSDERGLPIACSLTASEMSDRSREFADLARRALLTSERTVGGLRLRYRWSEAVEEEVLDLVRREQQCCPFFRFHVSDDREGLLLEVTAPVDADRALDVLQEVAAPGRG